MHTSNYKVILFDLGGVLLKLGDPISTFSLRLDESDFLRTWIMSPSVRALESGQIDSETFAERMIAEMDLSMDTEELLRRFNGWPDGFYPHAIDLIARMPSRYSCAILSNTNAIHWQQVDVPGNFGDRFDRYFLSYQTGLLKPDQDAFLQVIASYACVPQEILFFDDNPINVAAARDEGLSAVLVQGPDQLEVAMIDAGLFD